MTIESATSVYYLNTSLPADGDEQSEGDDHIRLLKSVIKSTFPGLGGALGRSSSKAITFSPAVTENTCLFHCTASVTMNLLAVAGVPDGTYYFVNAFGGDVTVDPNGAELVNGVATVVIPQNSWAFVAKVGTGWAVMVSRGLSQPVAGEIHAATAKATPVAADEFMLVDSADSWKLKKLTLTDLRLATDRFGGSVNAEGTGITDWNNVNMTRGGPAPYLIRGTATNGPGPAHFYHILNFEYYTRNGTGDLTQVAIPYGGSGVGNTRWYVRSRFSGTWSSWAAIPTTADAAGFATGASGGVSSVGGYTGAVTAAQVATAAANGWGATPSFPGHTHSYAPMTAVVDISNYFQSGDLRFVRATRANGATFDFLIY